ncbi:MAG: SMR family transporter [Betaproteobacteria bacterium]
MSWIYLVLAGLLEIGWPIGLKVAQGTEQRWFGIAGVLLIIGGVITLRLRH